VGAIVQRYGDRMEKEFAEVLAATLTALRTLG